MLRLGLGPLRVLGLDLVALLPSLVLVLVLVRVSVRVSVFAVVLAVYFVSL